MECSAARAREGEWLWRVTWHDGRAYGVTYKTLPGERPESALKLVSSADGRAFERVATLSVPGQPNETTLRFMPDGEMVALVRREAGDRLAGSGAAGRHTRPGRGGRRRTRSVVRTSSACRTARCGQPAAAIQAGRRQSSPV